MAEHRALTRDDLDRGLETLRQNGNAVSVPPFVDFGGAWVPSSWLLLDNASLRTALGQRLLELRAATIASGARLLDWDGIEAYRRGDAMAKIDTDEIRRKMITLGDDDYTALRIGLLWRMWRDSPGGLWCQISMPYTVQTLTLDDLRAIRQAIDEIIADAEKQREAVWYDV